MSNISNSIESRHLLAIKRLRITVIALSGIILAGIAFYLLTKPSEFDLSDLTEKRLGLVPTAEAYQDLDAYRHDGAFAKLSLARNAKVQLILHDTDSVRNYINTSFKDFVDSHDHLPGYVWQIGIYPMVCKDTVKNALKPRIGVYLIPTMVLYKDKKIIDIVDYYTAIHNRDSVFYIRRGSKLRLFDDSTDNYIFDEGHMWP